MGHIGINDYFMPNCTGCINRIDLRAKNISKDDLYIGEESSAQNADAKESFRGIFGGDF